jgi:hypothetical protein
MDKSIFSKKARVLQFGRALAQNSGICLIMSYLLMKVAMWWPNEKLRIDFSCGANL